MQHLRNFNNNILHLLSQKEKMFSGDRFIPSCCATAALWLSICFLQENNRL